MLHYISSTNNSIIAQVENGINNIKIYYPNGNIKEINNYKKGKLEGISEMYYDDGKTLMIQGNFKNNLLDGIYRELYKNGKTKLKKE